MKTLKLFLSFVLLSIFAFSCSSVPQSDYALRIKPEAAKRHNNNPYTQMSRNGSALRGTIIKVEFVSSPDSCPVNEFTKIITKGYVLFVDSASESMNEVERIPIDDIDNVVQNIVRPINQYGNKNYFETYNHPLLPRDLKEVPVDTVFEDPCSVPCPCDRLSIGLPSIGIKCPDRELSWLFFEIKPGYAIYTDVNEKDDKIGKDDWMFDVAAGIRFGSSKRWGLGVLLSSGVKVFDSYDSSSYKRMNVSLYGRYDLFRKKERLVDNRKIMDTISIIEKMMTYDTTFIKVYDPIKCAEKDSMIIKQNIKPNEIVKYQEKIQELYKEIEVRPCLNPFIYGLLGASVDKFSMDLFDINLGTGCKSKVDASGGDLDISMPINYGFGIGVEIPICKSFDISADLGFRSVSYGERKISGGYIVPTNKRINSFVFRLGIAY